MIEFYLKAIEHNNTTAMNNYALWCEEHGTEDDVKKYYLMAIEHDNTSAMYNYAHWCEDHGSPQGARGISSSLLEDPDGF